MPQRLMVALYDIGLPAINHHIKQVYADGEQLEEATIRYFRIVQQEGTRQVTRQVAHYNLKMIIAVGFKVNSPRAVQFRKWANAIIQDFTVKGWAMDEERLKSGGSRLTEKPRHAPSSLSPITAGLSKLSASAPSLRTSHRPPVPSTKPSTPSGPASLTPDPRL